MKSKTMYICSACGYQSPKWSGKCPDCGEWNSLVEEVVAEIKPSKAQKSGITFPDPVSINDISVNTEIRFKSGISELDRVLGGGIVEGSLVLVGGEPGIGKSTLLLQICKFAKDDILYISGEESASQIKLRAKRLEVSNEKLSLLCTTNLESVVNAIEKNKPKIAIVDSVQTISSAELSSAPGTVSQIREVTLSLMQVAKNNGTTVFIVGHVTKEGSIAGPRVLEHMVDCVLYFEGEKQTNFRILRAVKNRFGSTNELGIFEMHDTGLAEVLNPSLTLLENHQMLSSGCCITCTVEGTRPILAEVQSLVSPTFFPMPRRTASGLDYNKVMLLLAVLEKRVKLNLGVNDIYVNIAGGMRIFEPSSDLAVILAVYSGLKDIIIDPKTIAIGEVGLSGEVRAVASVELRINEAKKMGFKKIIVPYGNFIHLKDKTGVFGVKSIADAINLI